MLLFIYGTLKRGCYNHHYMDGQRFVGTARTAPRYRLHNLGGYPGMVLAGSGNGSDGENNNDPTNPGLSIEGEVWDIDDTCRARLDILEGVEDGEYVLEPVPLLDAPFASQVIQGYRYLRSTQGKPDISPVWTEQPLK